MLTQNTRLPYCIDSKGSLTVVLDGRPYTVVSTSEHYVDIIALVRQGRVQELYHRLGNRPLARGRAEYRDGRVYINGGGVPLEFSDRITRLVLQGKPIGGWLNFMERLRQNVDAYVTENLHRLLVSNCLKVTAAGEILGYKSVTRNYTDHWTSSMTYAAGQVYTMSRELVCADPDTACGPGLHFGTLSYTRYQYPGSPVYLVKVAPEDVVSVPRDSESRKCRCCRFEVVRLLTEAEVENGKISEEYRKPSGIGPDPVFTGDLLDDEDDYDEDDYDEDDYDEDDYDEDAYDEDAYDEDDEDEDGVHEFLGDETDDTPEDIRQFPLADDVVK